MLVKKMPRWTYLLMKNFLSFRCSKDPGYIKTGVGSNPEVLISFDGFYSLTLTVELVNQLTHTVVTLFWDWLSISRRILY